MLPGDSLRDVLRQPPDNIAGKLDLIEQVYRQIRQRHELALFTGDSRWIHPDANTGNIVVTGDAPIWIDIETQPRDVNPVDAAAEEVAKFTLCAANDLSGEHLDAICARWIAVYRGLEFVPRRFCRKTVERRFQRIHLWRDRRRKLAMPGLVTKYDLADCLRRSLAAKHAAA
jgi:tRNA A-37 threonylcarbamoyl transferase component Bud32